ncbi:MAG: DoxX family protein [Arenibacter sp.]|uniref:DoxX family protein n=1 Tax=Arenibacter TaxID=178469 RepID=UPI000A367F83|nr:MULTISPECIES: DoxX family protein [Arenibacter]MDX1327524.1 DoxX family protein [Arenibacter sp.]
MIKKIFNPGETSNTISYAILLLRLAAGVFMLTHGMGKLSALFGSDPIQFPDPIGLGATVSLALTVFSEVFCSLLLILGLGTRFATLPLLITMLVAAFIVHATDGFGRQELPLFYATVYVVIGLLGAGKISLDNLVYAKIKEE